MTDLYRGLEQKPHRRQRGSSLGRLDETSGGSPANPRLPMAVSCLKSNHSPLNWCCCSCLG